jgi:aryl-alcohol dehydrogenase-like predicted oxidoreductase
MLAGVTGVTIISKGGLVRDGARWVADGRAGRLREAVKATTERLGRRPDGYLLHAVDRKVKLATSVRALAELKERGEVGELGICNVSRGQVEEALALAPLWAVQVELNPWELGAVRGGLVALCEERGLWLMAHRPLGGVAKAEARRRHPQVGAIAQAAGCSVEELVLAWLARLSPRVVPVPGVTKVEQVAQVVRAARMELDEEVVREVSRAFGLYAVVAVDEKFQAMIHDGASEAELDAHARRDNPSLLDDGVDKVRAGVTTVEEVARVVREEA